MTTATIIAEYRVTVEQLDACQRWQHGNTHSVFYTVESASQPGTYYKVVWNAVHKCLQCLPHTGEVCKASLYGLPCWHKRAALAAEHLYKAEVRSARQREQAEVEMTEAYALEQAMIELEKSQALLDAYLAEVDSRKAQERRQHGALNYNRGFSLLK